MNKCEILNRQTPNNLDRANVVPETLNKEGVITTLADDVESFDRHVEFNEKELANIPKHY